MLYAEKLENNKKYYKKNGVIFWCDNDFVYIRTYFLVETMWCSPLSSYNHNIKTYLSNLWHANCYKKYWHLVNQHPTSHIANMPHSQHLKSHIPNIPHAKHPTSPTSQIFSIPHPQLSTYPNIPHPQHSTSLTSHIPHTVISKYPTSQTSHIANIPHPEHTTFPTSHI